MSGIDHKALMLDAIEVAANSNSYEMTQSRLALAQVHATALLAEQQHLANVVAAFVPIVFPNGDSVSTIECVYPPTFRMGVEKALGLS